MHDTDSSVSRQIVAILKAQQLSQRDFASAIGMPYRTVQNYLTGLVKIPSGFLEQTCNALGVEADYLIFGSVIIDRTALLSAVEHVFSEMLSQVEFSRDTVQMRRDGINEFPDNEAALLYAKSIALQVTAAISDRYLARRNRTLSDGPLKE